MNKHRNAQKTKRIKNEGKYRMHKQKERIQDVGI